MRTWKKAVLAAILSAGFTFFCDAARAPEHQFSAWAYIGAVHTYQEVGRPWLDGIVACRYRPTCSEYSVQAVQRYGICRGLYLTAKRLASCTNDVPMGTVDELV